VLSLHLLEHQLALVVAHSALIVLDCHREVELGLLFVFDLEHEAEVAAFLLAVYKLQG
jgi:hypothetical protein